MQRSVTELVLPSNLRYLLQKSYDFCKTHFFLMTYTHQHICSIQSFYVCLAYIQYLLQQAFSFISTWMDLCQPIFTTNNRGLKFISFVQSKEASFMIPNRLLKAKVTVFPFSVNSMICGYNCDTALWLHHQYYLEFYILYRNFLLPREFLCSEWLCLSRYCISSFILPLNCSFIYPMQNTPIFVLTWIFG